MHFIKTCPTCGSNAIKRVTRDLVRDAVGAPYTVPAVTFHECPDCGEKLFDPDAMRTLERHRPDAAATQRHRRKSA